MSRRGDGGSNFYRARREQWREHLPEFDYLVNELSPRLLESADERRLEGVAQEWKDLVSRMRGRVHREADTATYHDEESSLAQRRGYHWHLALIDVRDMLRHLTRAITADLEFEEGATLASIVLLDSSALHLQLELRDGSSPDQREELENAFRIQSALRALCPRFDGVQLLRLRALQVAEAAARLTHIPSEEEIAQRLREIVAVEQLRQADAARTEDFIVSQPAMFGVMVRSWLAEVDRRFNALDPLVVMEEFADATSESSGGRASDGEGRFGPARALARLSVMCGALDLVQRDDEDFDAAVERVRGSLLMARTRIRKAVHGFPTGFPDEGAS